MLRAERIGIDEGDAEASFPASVGRSSPLWYISLSKLIRDTTCQKLFNQLY
jgi:hypothetical protein